MKTIIAPVDFSSISYNACLYAAKMAEDIKAELVLLHVMELPVSVTEFPLTEEAFNEISMETELENLKKKLLAETGNNITISSKNILGSIDVEIKDLCHEKNPFALVMGTHSYSFLDRFFVGSTTIYAAQHLHYPVLIIPQNAKYKSVKKIALASDLKNIYDVPSHEIETIVRSFNAVFEIFYAGENEKDISRNAVGSLLLDHRLINLDPQFYFIENEDVLKGITSLTKEHDIDILMIVPKKHGPLHKSQSKDFIFNFSFPVMAIHENDFAQQV
jgi:nucleotide-binding universal stress UspA family protein